MNGELEVRRVRYDALVAEALVAGAMLDLAERYGGGDDTPVSATDFEPPAGAFLVAFRSGEPVGCAGWRSHAGTGCVAELKRLYLIPAARGQGIARRLLAAVEESARGHGRSRIILECGLRQPEAIGLYRSAGYQRIADFGFYRDEPDVISFGRDLSDRLPADLRPAPGRVDG